MDSIITTPRLKLTLIISADRGSQEFNWIHELRSNEQSSWWSIYGPSKSHDDTEKALRNILHVVQPKDEFQPESGSQKKSKDRIYRIPYAVHSIHPTASSTTFIGLITLRSLSPTETLRPPRSTHASTPSTLSLELAYMFLPAAWGKGYATESIGALFEACRDVDRAFWDCEKVYVRAIVNDENIASQRVMEKCVMNGKGKGQMQALEFSSGEEKFCIAGKWRSEHRLCVYGMGLVG